MTEFIERIQKFQEKVLGPFTEDRTASLIDHIRKECDEVLNNPDCIEEWADIILLGFAGATRTGALPELIWDTILYKMDVNEYDRKWPDWRTVEEGKALEHIKEV